MLDFIQRTKVQCKCVMCGCDFERPAIRPGTSVWETHQYLHQGCRVCDSCREKAVAEACGIKMSLRRTRRKDKNKT